MYDYDILNSILGKKKNLNELNSLQKLYLFFISYLVEGSKISQKEVSLEHALKTLETQIKKKMKDLEKYTQKDDKRNIKKCKKYIENREKQMQQLIDSDGKNRENRTCF